MTSLGASTAPHSKPIGWGIIGTSSIVRAHMADAIRLQPPARGSARMRIEETDAPYPRSTVVAIYSPDALRARMFADSLHIPYSYSQLDQMLNRRDLQCVYVANHPRHHAHSVMAALNAGKHVLCEAPLALDTAAAEEVIFKAALRGLQVGINAPWRVDSAVQRLQQLIADREIGDLIGGRIVNANLLPLAKQGWRLLPNGGGVHFDRTQRDLDLLFFLTGCEVAEVYATSTTQILGAHSNFDVPEDLVSIVTLANAGPTFQLYDSFLTPHVACSVEVYGSGGYAVITDWFDADVPTSLQLVRNNQWQTLKTPQKSPYVTTVDAFARAIQSGQGLPATGDDGLRALRNTLAIQESLVKHRPISPPRQE
jgi:1,5-anhydro-D-fructose reductase (1,5-anhydro-D-mannitol-forming)